MKSVRFAYPPSEGKTQEEMPTILDNITLRLTLNARAAIVGKNGAGKTTLLRLLIGELDPLDGVGDVWKHHNLRVAYIAQHSMHHLEASLEKTPLAYLQNRFAQGKDHEVAARETMKLTPEEKEIMQKRGKIYEVIGRAKKGKSLMYEFRRVGQKEEDTDWDTIEALKLKEPYVMKLVKNYDEFMKARQSGMELRSVTRTEVVKHLAEFGINSELALGKIKQMSAGQRSRLVLAAAMWTRPHFIAVDEPTNYIDNETLAALIKALAAFKGGVVTISHNQAFVQELCKEQWKVQDGSVEILDMNGNPVKLDLKKGTHGVKLKNLPPTDDFSH